MPLPIQTGRIVRLINKAVESVSIDITLDATSGLIEDTPIDTGWARANWVPSVGRPVTSPIGFPGDVETSPQQSGRSKIANYSLSDGALFISNNVPYIETLNGGSSSQASAGFVEENLDRAVEKQNGRKFL